MSCDSFCGIGCGHPKLGVVNFGCTLVSPVVLLKVMMPATYPQCAETESLRVGTRLLHKVLLEGHDS